MAKKMNGGFLVFFFNSVTSPVNYTQEALAGITVALALIPEALAFSIIAGVPPTTGLYAAFMVGLVTAITGGRPGMISGATGAIAVGLASLTRKYGIEYLFAAVMLAGVFEIITGVFKLAKLIRLVSRPVMIGFVNGLAIIIFMSQLVQFKINIHGKWLWLTQSQLYMMVGLVALTIAVMLLVPRVTKSFPAALAGIISVFLLVLIFKIPTKTVGDIASVKGGFPPFHLANVPVNFNTLQIIFPYSVVMAGVGLIESLLTLNYIDEVTDIKGNGNKECIAQGIANILSGLFNGMGGCAMMGQSLVNMSAGGRGRLSGIIAAVVLLVFVIVGAPLIEKIPMAALTGVMIMVAIGTFKWNSFKIILKAPVADVMIMLTVTIITVMFDNLALAVLVGVIISALVFTWRGSECISVDYYLRGTEMKYYSVKGTLFFGSVAALIENFDVLKDPDLVIVNLENSNVTDMSGLEALTVLITKYKKAGKDLKIINISRQSLGLIKRTKGLFAVDILDHYQIH